MEARLYRIKVFKEKNPYFWVAYGSARRISFKLNQVDQFEKKSVGQDMNI